MTIEAWGGGGGGGSNDKGWDGLPGGGTGGTVTASAAAPRPVPSLSAGALGLLAGLLMLGAWRRRVH